MLCFNWHVREKFLTERSEEPWKEDVITGSKFTNYNRCAVLTITQLFTLAKCLVLSNYGFRLRSDFLHGSMFHMSIFHYNPSHFAKSTSGWHNVTLSIAEDDQVDACTSWPPPGWAQLWSAGWHSSGTRKVCQLLLVFNSSTIRNKPEVSGTYGSSSKKCDGKHCTVKFFNLTWWYYFYFIHLCHLHIPRQFKWRAYC